jgi:hypothetical protein
VRSGLRCLASRDRKNFLPLVIYDACGDGPYFHVDGQQPLSFHPSTLWGAYVGQDFAGKDALFPENFDDETHVLVSESRRRRNGL